MSTAPPRLTLEFLGPPRVVRDGTLVVVDTRKAVALLAYLAVTGQPHGRDASLAVLWPEYDQPSARASLRRTLSAPGRGSGATGSRWWGIRSACARPASGSTSRRFRALAEEVARHGHAPDRAVPGLRTPWLGRRAPPGRLPRGFTRDSPAFDDWQSFQADALGRWRRRLSGLAQAPVAQGDIEARSTRAGWPSIPSKSRRTGA